MNSHKNPQKGFTILVAVVTAGILLIIAMSIGGLALKEQVLSIANKESQVAFYAADTGLECALYQDQKNGAFGPGSDGNYIGTTAGFNCANSPITTADVVQIVNGPSHKKYSYSFAVPTISVGSGTAVTCAIVIVTKNTLDPAVCPNPALSTCDTKTHTTIQSYGYNTCAASLNRLERGVVSNN